jgi:hypothetical protein
MKLTMMVVRTIDHFNSALLSGKVLFLSVRIELALKHKADVQLFWFLCRADP